MSDDRTSEFLSLARSLPGAELRRGSPHDGGSAGAGSSNHSALANNNFNNNNSSNSNSNSLTNAKKTPSYAQELRQFHHTAAEISRDIAATSALLSELTRLVRQTSLFQEDDAQMRINQLVVRIKTSIENLNARLDQAGTTIAQQKRRLGHNSQVSQQTSNLVDGLKTEFAQAASGFKKVLQQRTDHMKESDVWQKSVYGFHQGDHDDGDNENAIMPTIASLAPPPVYGTPGGYGSGVGGAAATLTPPSFPTLDLTSSMMSTGEATGSGVLGGDSLPRPHGISGSASAAAANSGMRNRRLHSSDHLYGSSGTAAGSYSYDRQHSAPLTPLDIQRAEQEAGLQQHMQLIPDQTYLQERANAMSQVETNIVELGTIFNKLAVMVSEHQELVQRVEDNVQDANANINLSLGVLTDTLTSLRTNRTLALRVFSILVAFIIFFIVFFA